MPETASLSATKSTNVRKHSRLASPAGQAALLGTLSILQRVAPGAAAVLAERLFFTPPPPRGDGPPPEAERLDVSIDGRPLAAWRWGLGPAVVLVHGWGGWGGQLASFAPVLVAEGFSVVSFDAPAHGGSPGRQSSIPDFARTLRAVAEAAGPVRGVIAHSLGAAATALAVRDGFDVERVVFVAPPSDPASWMRRFAQRLGLRERVLDRVGERATRRFGFHWKELYVPALARALRGRLLVVHDRDDREVPWWQGRAVADAAAAPLVTTAGLGHQRLLSDEGVAAITAAYLGGGSVLLETGSTRLARPCEAPGCDRPAERGQALCDRCDLEGELFDAASRRRRPAA
jgi:pimeloyl-ACP methyl ester carboxylesterase